MRTFLSDMIFGRRSVWMAGLVVALCLAISACVEPQATGQSAGPTATPTSASHSRLPCGASCGGSGGGGVNTPAPTPAKLSASPTTVGSWQTCGLNATCAYPGKLYSTVTLSNGGSSSLSWSIGQTTSDFGANGVKITPTSGTIAPGGQSILTLLAPPAFIQALQNGTVHNQWFDAVGPANTVQVTLA
jgi:hypothetical protein